MDSVMESHGLFELDKVLFSELSFFRLSTLICCSHCEVYQSRPLSDHEFWMISLKSFF